MRFREYFGTTRVAAILAGTLFIFVAFFLLAWFLPLGEVNYSSNQTASVPIPPPEKPKIYHLSTPYSVKAIYLSSYAAGSEKFRKEIFDLASSTEINAVVIDIKDYTGRISFPVTDPKLVEAGSATKRIPDIADFIHELHEAGVYVIGRISSFQDSYLINIHPEWAVKTKAGKIWQDYKGVKWLDAGAKPVADYLVAIGKESYALGFDELNFDYIRFPSDGNMKDVSYSWQNGRSRQEVMRSFFSYLHDQFASTSIPISADFFGLTTSAEGDLGIGQVLTDALEYFDYVAPMVYPSHFANGFLGFKKAAEHPYEVIKYSMGKAVERAIASSTHPEKLRPWLQDFDLGAKYTPDMVRAQIQATYDVGLNSFMLWNAAGIYQKAALLPKGELGFDPFTSGTTTSPTISSKK